jgi:hypothetical protein
MPLAPQLPVRLHARGQLEKVLELAGAEVRDP